MEGWIKLHRCLLHNPLVMKDADYLAVWCYLLLKATHSDYSVMFGGKNHIKAGAIHNRQKEVVLGITYKRKQNKTNLK